MKLDMLVYTVHFKIALELEIRAQAVQLAKHSAIFRLTDPKL